jgi:hypothetical protein
MVNIQRIGWHTLAGREHLTNDVPFGAGRWHFMGPCSAATVLARTPLCREPVRETADEGIARIEFRLLHELGWRRGMRASGRDTPLPCGLS